MPICRRDRQLGNLGYWVSNLHWGKGFGLVIASAGLQIGFAEIGLHRIEAVIDPDNLHSIRVAEKAGMINEGLKAKLLLEDGDWIDQVVFSAIPEMFVAKKAPRNEVERLRFNALIPELLTMNFQQSLEFYLKLGFSIEYQRPEDMFAFLSFQGTQLMIEQQNDVWKVGPLEPPYGRGVNFQITVDRLEPILASLKLHSIPLFTEPVETWYRKNSTLVGQKEFLV
jgi:hypothetical protein